MPFFTLSLFHIRTREVYVTLNFPVVVQVPYYICILHMEPVLQLRLYIERLWTNLVVIISRVQNR